MDSLKSKDITSGRSKVLLALMEGAFKCAHYHERDPEVAKEWAQDAMLRATIKYDRYTHLPEDQQILVLGMVIRNHILSLQRREVTKDYLIKPEPEFLQHRSTEDSPLEDVIGKELLAVLLTKLNPDEQRFVREKLRPSAETLQIMQHEGHEGDPLDRHVLPWMSKAMVSRTKSNVRSWIERLTVLSIRELQSLDRQRALASQRPAPEESDNS